VSRRVVRAGAGLVALYVVVAFVTAQVSSRPVLPLFDGFAPPVPYNWVNPPPELAAGNTVPPPVERQFPVGPEGAPASNASSDDAQIIVGLDNGSVPASPPDTTIAVRMVPLDPGTLGPLPPGLRAVSNAYRVSLTYLPSQAPLTRLAVKGTIALTAGGTGDRMLYSADGQTWEERPFRPFGQDHGLFTELEAVGWFVVASTSTQASSDGGEESDVLQWALLVTVFLAGVVGAYLVVRLPSPVPATRPPARRPARPAPKKAKRPRR
jgi:hypothetical protein